MMTNTRHGVLYVGVTNDLVRRVYEHRHAEVDGFTKRYNLGMLVWFEAHDTAPLAIAREKQLKKWKRAWKLDLIDQLNPEWQDLFDSIAQ